MKKEESYREEEFYRVSCIVLTALVATLFIIVGVLVADVRGKGRKLAEWESSAKSAMDEMGVRVNVLSVVAPTLPDDPPERLRALADEMGKLLGRCRVDLAIAEAKLGGYYDPHAHPEQ